MNEMKNNARGFPDFLLTIRARLRRLHQRAVTALLARECIKKESRVGMCLASSMANIVLALALAHGGRSAMSDKSAL